MLTLQRYILFLLAPFWLGTIAGLVLLAAMLNSVTFLPKVISDEISIWILLKFVSFGVPVAVWLVLPITLFLAIMVVYARLKNDSELTVMQATGLSMARLGVPAILLALCGCGIMSYLVSVGMPLANQSFRVQKNELVFELTPAFLQAGQFLSPVDGVTLYVREKRGANLYGVLIRDVRDRRQSITITANSAQFEQTEAGNFVLVLREATRVEARAGKGGTAGGRPSYLYFDRYAYEHVPEKSAADMKFIKPRELYIPQLWDWYQRGVNKRFQAGYLAELIDRLLTPLLPLGYSLLALSIILQGQQGRGGTGKQTMLAIACVLGTEIARFVSKSAASETMALAPVLVIAELSPFLLALAFWLAMRARGYAAYQALAKRSAEPVRP